MAANEFAILPGDAEAFMVRRLAHRPDGFRQYGYDVYLPSLIEAYLAERAGPNVGRHEIVPYVPGLSPSFYAAAWELCRRGVLRPGISQLRGQVTEDGSGGNGYSFTPWGREWLASTRDGELVTTDPTRLATLLRPFEPLYGPGFLTRGIEAVTCYRFRAYLACCVMCGAAAESILLSLAIKKAGREDLVLREYAAAGGRSKIERRLTGGLPDHLKDQFTTGLSLLKYWRDESGHGRASSISEIEAFTALALLIRTAQFARDEYSRLTGHRPPGALASGPGTAA